MGKLFSKSGEKADAKEKYKSRTETENNHHDITIVTNKGNTIKKQTSKPDKNDSNNAGSTDTIVSGNKQPSDQKPDVSESHHTDKKPGVSDVPSQKPNGSSKKKKKHDADSTDSYETSDNSSDTDSSDSDNDQKRKKSRRKHKKKDSGTTFIDKNITVRGDYINVGPNAENVTLTINNGYCPPQTTVKPEDQKTGFEPFNEQTRRDFFSYRSGQGISAGNFIYLPKDSTGRVEEAIVTQRKNELAPSVCRIQYPGGSGSGFRVGLGNRNLLCTANHVVREITDAGLTNLFPSRIKKEEKLDDGNVWCVFNHLTNNFSISEMDKFYFKPVVLYSSCDTDIAILELKDNQYGTPMPPPFTLFRTPFFEQTFHLVGHPEGGQKKWCRSDYFINVKSPETANHINILRRWCQDCQLRCEADENNLLDNPKRWLFHVAENFTKGASGCPGLDIRPHEVSVVTVLLRGYPDWFYDSNIPCQTKATLPTSYRVEQGANLESLYLDMFEENPELCMEIFRESIATQNP